MAYYRVGREALSVMAVVSYADMRRNYLANFGELIITWNQAEGVLRNLLMSVCGRSPATYILTAELGSRGLTDGLNAIAVTQNENVKEAILAVVILYDRLREYRNYYVHGLTAIGVRNGVGFGSANMASAKGKLGFSTDEVPVEQLDDLTKRLRLLTTASIAILDTIDPQEGSMVPQALPTRATLPIPDRLRKNLRYPLNDPQPPQSEQP